MRSSSREEIVEVLDVVDAGHKRALDLTFGVLTMPDRLAVLERLEVFRRQQPAVEHVLINQLGEQADPTELGGKLAPGLADRLRISRAEASQLNGGIGAGHVAVIRAFFHRGVICVDLLVVGEAGTCPKR